MKIIVSKSLSADCKQQYETSSVIELRMLKAFYIYKPLLV